MIGSVIITYNPDISTFSHNIKLQLNQVEKIVVVDNGSKNLGVIKENIRQNFNNQEKISWICLKKNKGIAFAQNKGIEFLKNLGYEWALTMDQDTAIPENMVFSFIKSKAFKIKSTAIIAPQFDDISWNSNQRRERVQNNKDSISVDKVIASGNLVRISAWNDVGGFDNMLFIDQVDFDFDAKLKLLGYTIWQLNSVIIKHSLGETTHKPIRTKLLGFSKATVVTNHSAFREYYINRNAFIYVKRYPEFRWKKHFLLAKMLQNRIYLLYDGPRIPKLRAMIRGMYDGIKYDPKKDKQFMAFRKRIENNRVNNVSRREK